MLFLAASNAHIPLERLNSSSSEWMPAASASILTPAEPGAMSSISGALRGFGKRCLSDATSVRSSRRRNQSHANKPYDDGANAHQRFQSRSNR